MEETDFKESKKPYMEAWGWGAGKGNDAFIL